MEVKNNLSVQKRLGIFVVLCFAYCINFADGERAYLNAMRIFRNDTFANKPNEKLLSLASNRIITDLRNLRLSEDDQKYSKCNGVDIREISILEIQNEFAKGRLTSVELTDCYLRRIHHMNYVLRAVIEINRDAIRIAYQADLERKSGKKLSPLHGIPVLIKDNIGTHDLMETTAGAWALLGVRPKRDSDVVAALRKAGAIIIGKANLSELSNFRGTNIPSGWSGRGGQTRNAYNLLETPEGSSSGPCVAVSANLAPVSLGSETDGSLTCPASVASLCTIRSTVGLISTYGVIPISHNQDVVGPLARTVTDLAIVFDAMIPEKVKRRRASSCDGSYLNCITQGNNLRRPLRLGVLRYPFWDRNFRTSPEFDFQLPLLEKVLDTLKDTPNLEIIDYLTSPFDLLAQISDLKELIVLLHDDKYGINKYLENDVFPPSPTPIRPGYPLPATKMSSLADIIQYNIDHPTPEGYNQELLLMAQATDGLQNVTYIEARDTNRAAARAFLDSVLNGNDLDAIVVPSDCSIHASTDPNWEGVITNLNSISCVAGYPAVVVPAGIGLEGVPFGIEFVGRRNSEDKLFQIAYTVEQSIKKREAPKFIAKVTRHI